MPTIQAQDIVNAAIQDSQNQTTNRTALYDYTDRIHQRILRESLWRFLLSDPEYFITLPGVASYTLTSTPGPSYAFKTNLNLADFGNIAPGTVYNATSWQRIEEDSDTQQTLNYLTLKDGSLRAGAPRTYQNSIANPGTITLRPAPDANNFYYPVPETPYVTFAPLAGCTLPNRIYWGVVTYVDSLGGESTKCVIPFTIAVPAGNVITVNSPNGVPGGSIAANQAQYSSYNLYMGTVESVYYLQNATPITLGTSWTETAQGINLGTFPVPSTLNIPTNTALSINPDGTLTTVTYVNPIPVFPWTLIDSNHNYWEIIYTGGLVQTQSVAPSSTVFARTTLYLQDSSGQSWAVTVDTNGLLVTTAVSSAPVIPVQTSTIQPLNAYVIQFRYYKQRNQISQPTDVLQIPYVYKDIVIAGVNYLVNLYLDPNTPGRAEKLAQWKRDFDMGIAQIRRDLRVNFRKTDFIAPDPTTQYIVGNQQGIPTMGW